MAIITFIVYAFYAYLLAGLAFGLWFISSGVEKVDEGMHKTSWVIRMLLLPGSAAFWPLLLSKYLAAQRNNRLGGRSGNHKIKLI